MEPEYEVLKPKKDGENCNLPLMVLYIIHYIYHANQNINVTFESHCNYIKFIARSTLYHYNRSQSSPLNVLSSNEAKLNKAEYYIYAQYSSV
jgi:hypothetical protein